MAPWNDTTPNVPESGSSPGAPGLAREPGAVLLYDGTEPACRVIPIGEGALELGRDSAAIEVCRDPAMSRRHARLAYHNGRFQITELGGKNGTALDGTPVSGEAESSTARLLRLGHSLFLLCHDVRPYRTLGVKTAGQRIEGPAMQLLMRQVAALAQLGHTLLILGDSGTGKESIAQAFHAHGPKPSGPFIAVNCATLPAGVAERLLFGAQKGAYSGAVADSPGYLVAAAGGTLFLDELGELDAAVQAKLLRVLETGEVMPLGSTRARKIELRICCATHRPLRELVNRELFRADLYFRLSTPHVQLPSLWQRPEEIPWHVSQVVREVDPALRPHASLIESCLLRAWPGNVRELLLCVRTASVTARLEGCDTVGPQHLPAQAGAALLAAPKDTTVDPRDLSAVPPLRADAASANQPYASPPASEGRTAPVPGRAKVKAALARVDGNVSAAARELGLQRTQLRRLLARYQIDIQKLRDGP